MRQNGFAQILVLLILLGGIVTGVILTQHPQIFQPKAKEISNQAILIGTNYTHYSNLNCSLDDTGILANYHKDGGEIRHTVQYQLSRMAPYRNQTERQEKLDLLIWHMTDIGDHKWGVIPSVGGKITEPYETNLINYLTDIKSAGFNNIHIAFAPMWTNSPMTACPASGCYDPLKFNENWNFIKDVRTLIKQYGPPETTIDLLVEGAPSNYRPESMEQIKKYIADMYRNYVSEFGKSDVVVSAIAPFNTQDQGKRLENLIDAFNSTGLGQPNLFHFSLYPDGASEQTTYDVLKMIDNTLRERGLNQPIVIRETLYNNQNIANGIARFIRDSSRKVAEVNQWPLTYGSSCKDISESAPYNASVYISTLKKTQGSGSLSCSMQTPQNVNQLGTAKIQSSWNNIAGGSAGSPKVSICVTSNADGSGPVLMSSDGGYDGSHIDNPAWIQADYNYTFTLYDQHGGDLPDCGGEILDSCDIQSETIPSGTISCDPTNPSIDAKSGLGTSNIGATYKAFIPGYPSADICVSQNNQPYVLFAGGGGPSGSINSTAPWIQPSNTYTFNLFSLSNKSSRCSGIVINSCTVKTP